MCLSHCKSDEKSGRTSVRPHAVFRLAVRAGDSYWVGGQITVGSSKSALWKALVERRKLAIGSKRERSVAT